tara:strand:+ start:4045 stop:4470 length:426 start_codon:yes stop_codon:yes gene_type:complete
MVIADPVTTVSGLLNSNWNASNTNSRTPKIGDSWDIGKLNMIKKDLIKCYEVSGTHEVGLVGKTLDRGSWRVSVDMSTPKSRTHLRDMYGEVLRILRLKEIDPNSSYQLLRPVSRVDNTDRNKRWYRYILDLELTSYEVIA